MGRRWWGVLLLLVVGAVTGFVMDVVGVCV
jgi:hypothetical protein